MRIGDLKQALAQMPDEMSIMVLGDGIIVEAHVGDSGDLCDGKDDPKPAPVLWLIGADWELRAREFA